MNINTFRISEQSLHNTKKLAVIIPITFGMMLILSFLFMPFVIALPLNIIYIIMLGTAVFCTLFGIIIWFNRNQNRDFKVELTASEMIRTFRGRQDQIEYADIESVTIVKTKKDGIITIDVKGNGRRLLLGGLSSMPRLAVQLRRKLTPNTIIKEKSTLFNLSNPTFMVGTLFVATLFLIVVVQYFDESTFRIIQIILLVFLGYYYGIKRFASATMGKWAHKKEIVVAITYLLLAIAMAWLLFWQEGTAVFGNSPCGWIGKYVHKNGCIATFERGNNIAFFPDNETIAYSTFNAIVLAKPSGWIGFWTPVLRHDDRLEHFLLSDNGRILVSETRSTVNGRQLWIWDTATKQLLSNPLPPKSAQLSFHAALSPDGNQLAFATQSEDNPIVEIWNISPWEKQASFQNSSGAVAFSPNGTLLATMQNKETIVIWHISAQQEQTKLHLPEKTHRDVQTLQFSPDNNLLIGQLRNQNLFYIWDIESGELLHQLGDNNFSVSNAFAISPNSSIFVTGFHSIEKGAHVLIWDLTTGQLQKSLNLGKEYRFGIDALEISTNG